MGKRKPRTKLHTRELEEVRALLKEGKAVKAIALATGISTSKVYQIRRDYVPRLRILSPSVEVRTDRHHIARYATVVVSAVSKVEAAGCEAWVQAAPSGFSAPLHWAGLLYTPEESTTPPMTIRPERAARLDVAFALPPPEKEVLESASAGALISGQVAAIRFGEKERYMPGGLWNGEGCWLAVPVALYNPDLRQEAYIKPGVYRIAINVYCPGGEGDSQEFVLLSPDSWEGLQLSLA